MLQVFGQGNRMRRSLKLVKDWGRLEINTTIEIQLPVNPFPSHAKTLI